MTPATVPTVTVDPRGITPGERAIEGYRVAVGTLRQRGAICGSIDPRTFATAVDAYDAGYAYGALHPVGVARFAPLADGSWQGEAGLTTAYARGVVDGDALTR